LKHFVSSTKSIGKFGVYLNGLFIGSQRFFVASKTIEDLASPFVRTRIVRIELNSLFIELESLFLANAIYASPSSREGTYDLDIPQLQSIHQKHHVSRMRTLLPLVKKTEAERVLLDVFAQRSRLEEKEKRIRINAAINTLLQESVREGYVLNFHERDGIYLQTSSGMLIWLASACTQDKAIEILIYDRENLSSSEEQ